MAFHRATTSFTVGRDGRPDLQIAEGSAYDDGDPELRAVIARFPDRFDSPEKGKR